MAASPASAQAPVANFTANVTSGCAPLGVRFSDLSTGNPTSWNWEFSNGTLSSEKNPVVTFTAPGTYSVKLVVQNGNGISQIERLDYITVFPAPNINFSANLNLACVPAAINFTDLTTVPPGSTISSWLWDFGDGTTSTQQNPSHTYNSTGFYGVSLTVTISNGCQRKITRGNFVRVVSGITTDFNFSPPSTCLPPFNVSFQNHSSGPGNISYSWDFGNGQTSTVANPSTVYNSGGTFTVRLEAQSNLGCSGSVEKTITLTGITTDFNAPASVCLNRPVTFQNNSSAAPVQSSWNFGDGSVSAQINPVKTFLVPGTFDVTLVNEYESCTDSITKTVIVADKPPVDFIADDTITCNLPVNVQFTDLSVGANSWDWDFGDGSSSSQQNPTHLYFNPGSYTVSLTITTPMGCSNTLTKTAYIVLQPVAITLNVPAGGCAPFTYTPQAIIQTPDPVVSYTWDLGAFGAIFNQANPPPYTYATPGLYDISLSVTTQRGCTGSVTVPAGVAVGTRPTVGFLASPLNGCASDTFSFTNTSVTTPGALVDWFWDFGDGGTSVEENPQHVFIDTGSLTVTLIVSNNRCRDSSKQTIHVNPPVARFNYTVDCMTQMVSFRDSSLVDPALSPLTYLWEMGDPANTQFAVANPPPFAYPSVGTYDVKLTVTNGACSYQTTRRVVIANEQADFSISKNPVCRNEGFSLTAINSNAANIRNYQWIVDGTVLGGSGRSVTHSLPTNGSYDVTLSITDINGCITSRTATNFINVTGPTASFTMTGTGGCLNQSVSFNDQTVPAGTITNWVFDFGDSTRQSFSAPPFTHTYSQTGPYSVSMTVTDVNGCKDSYILPVQLLVTLPMAGFRNDSVYCPGVPMPFADSSAGAGLTYSWDFGNGNSSTLQNPTNVYPPGDNNYQVTLVVTDISGCVDTARRTVAIRSPQAAFRLLDSVTICPPLRTSFTFLGTNYKSLLWDFGDGNTSDQQNPVYFYNNFGTYTPTLYVYGPGGCVDSASSRISVYNPISSSRLNYGPVTTACNSLNIDFNVTVPQGFKYTVYFGDGAADSSYSPQLSHFYSRPGFYSPSIAIIDTVSGCTATVHGNPRIEVLGAIPLFGMDRDEFCDSGPVIFTDFTTKNDSIISRVWDFNDGTTSSVQSPVHDFSQPGTYLVSLHITTESNCSSSYTDTVFVYRTPRPAITARDTVCLNIAEPVNGSIAFPDSLATWSWTFGNGQNSSNQNNIITYHSTGDFSIQLVTTNAIGCSDTALKTVHVATPPTAEPVQDPITIISGASANLLMNYTGNIVSYNWTPEYRLSCFDCPTPVANPQFTTTYKVDVVDAYGCPAQSGLTVEVLCTKSNMFIPNTFSPNGDGQNEVFYPRGTGLYNIKSLVIFNRWGEVVFERREFAPNDASQGWNGTFKGKKASADVYVFLMEVRCENNVVSTVKGNVTLLR